MGIRNVVCVTARKEGCGTRETGSEVAKLSIKNVNFDDISPLPWRFILRNNAYLARRVPNKQRIEITPNLLGTKRLRIQSPRFKITSQFVSSREIPSVFITVMLICT